MTATASSVSKRLSRDGVETHCGNAQEIATGAGEQGLNGQQEKALLLCLISSISILLVFLGSRRHAWGLGANETAWLAIDARS